MPGFGGRPGHITMRAGSSGHCETAGYGYTGCDWVLGSSIAVSEVVIVKWSAALQRSSLTNEGQGSQWVEARTDATWTICE